MPAAEQVGKWVLVRVGRPALVQVGKLVRVRVVRLVFVQQQTWTVQETGRLQVLTGEGEEVVVVATEVIDKSASPTECSWLLGSRSTTSAVVDQRG